MASSQAREASGALMTDINVTPLVDVVLVLLLLMMVTATGIASRTIAVELPKAKSGRTEANKRPLLLAIDDSGTFFIDTERATEAGVRAWAHAAIAHDAQASMVVAADGRARHEAVVHALDVLRSERVVKIAIVVRAEPKP